MQAVNGELLRTMNRLMIFLAMICEPEFFN